jgi:signal transduction histidine kinase
MAVPNSPLFLIAKIDRDEVFHDLDTLTSFMAALCALALFAFALWLLHRQYQEQRLTLLLSERQQMQDELIATRDRLRELAGHDEAIREAERKHVARELHDELGQLLTALKMHLSLLQMQFDHVPGLMEKTEEMRLIVEKTITTVRSTVSHLRPPALDLGLDGALEWQADEFTRHSGIPCTYENLCCAPCVDTETVAVIFRLVQESLTNVSRHAWARRVVIRLSCGSGTLRLSISDDGRGFDIDETTHKRKNFGLVGMQERINLLHGQLKITSAPGQGTRIDIELPYSPPDTPGTPTPP